MQSEAAATENSSSSTRRLRNKPFTCCTLWKSTPCNGQRNSKERAGTVDQTSVWTLATKMKRKIDEFTAEFEQLTEWLEEVLGDKLKSTSKELMVIGVEPITITSAK